MANIKSSRKDSITSQKRRLHNTSRRSMMRTFIKKVRTAIASENKEMSEASFKKMQTIVDKCVSKRLIHKNKAARYKSILSLKINKLCKN